MFNGPVFLNETIQANARAVNAGGISESLDEANALYSRLSGASFKLVPSSFGRGVLYSGAPGVNGDLTWTRGGDAFRTNASGLIQRVPWNLVQQSQNFADSSWIALNSTKVSTTQTDPSGFSTALNVTWSSGGSKYFYRTQSGLTIGTTYTLSFYVKSSNSSKFRIYSESLGFTTSNLTSTSDFARYTLTFTANVTSGTIGLQSASDNTAADLIVAFAQLVEGTTAQTYLPTTDRLNFPRLSYMYGSCPSALLEPQRTNLGTNSQNFADASWTKDFSSVTANTTTSPDGSTNADTYTGSGATGVKLIYQGISVTNGLSYTSSIYAKKNTNNFIQILTSSAAFGANFWANFDLNNGVVGSVGSSATARIESVGNGWYRCSITGTAIITGVYSNAIYSLITSATSPRSESNSLSTSVFLYGAQLEAGAYPTTYISTTSATATRVADTFSRSNIYTNGLISASGGTWFFELKNNVVYARDNTQGMFIGDGLTSNAGNQIIIRATSGGRLALFKCIAGVPTQIYGTASDNLKLSIKWDGTSADVFANGTKVVTATSFTTTNMENLIGLVGTPVFIQQMALFPTPLSDTDCISLTADYTDGTSIVGDYERYVSQKSGAVENLNGVTNLIQNLK